MEKQRIKANPKINAVVPFALIGFYSKSICKV